MHRSIVPAVAGCLLLSSAAFAQVNPTPGATPAPAPAGDILPDRANAQGFIEFQTADEFLATELIGHAVVNPAEENLGAINNLIISAGGNLTGVIVGVGGFLGIGVKDVAISWDALTLGTIDGDLRIVLDADRAAIDAAPDFQTLAELGIERLAVDIAPPEPAVVPEPPAPAPAPVQPVPAPAPVEPAPAPVVPAPAPAPVEPAPAPAPVPVTPIGGPEIPVVPAPMEPAAAMAAAVTPTFMAAQDPTAILTAELLGRPVFNLQDEALGTVNDVIFNREPTGIVGLVVGVGGFLGIGAKDVAIAFDAVRTTVVDGELRLIFDGTRDTLNAAPAYQRLPD
ncbi:MAG: PRC-barrel domain-containing protein [Bauldia sp.]